MLKYMKNAKYNQDKSIATNYGKKINFKSIIFFVLVIITIILFAVFLKQNPQILDNANPSNTEINTEELIIKWDSNPELIDDRLTKDYPISFAISYEIKEYYLGLTMLCMYNDGHYVTNYYLLEDYDLYIEECLKPNAFVEKFKEDYETNVNSEYANLLSENVNPNDIREIYNLQYTIDDYSMENSVNTTSAQAIPISFYFVNYEVDDDGNISASSNIYYTETSNSIKTIKSEIGVYILEQLFKITGATLEQNE